MESGELEAKNHPLIKMFVNLFDETTSDGVPDFEDILQRPFMKFWRHFIIHTYDEEIADFRTTFYGTHITEIYQRECTGLLISEMGFGEAEDMIRNMNKKALDNRERIYASNSLFWKNNENKVYHQVKMPLRRKGNINEVLVCMTFDKA